tara:strand:+ start:2639 stop:5728 length:3090 start_codon:yes stop_codon:yes gene_type:complete
MAQRNAKTVLGLRLARVTAVIALLMVQTSVPLSLVGATELDDMDICGVAFGDESICDTRSDADDGTAGNSWVEGIYTFNMTSPTSIEFEASWAIREWDKSGLGVFTVAGMDVLLERDNIGPTDGIPADVLRGSFDNLSNPFDPESLTVKQTLLSEINGSITSLLSSWGGASNLQTDWATDIKVPAQNGGTTDVTCSTEIADSNDGNAFNPPICITTSVTISLSVSGTYGMSGVSSGNLNTAFEGLLIMGTEITTTFQVPVEKGYSGTFSIIPPSYATVIEAGGTQAELVQDVDDSGNSFNYGMWTIDNLGGLSSTNANLLATLGFRSDGVTDVVDFDSFNKSLDLSVKLDMADEQATSIEITAGIYQLPSSMLDDFSIMPSDVASVPGITADGIRMAYHTNLIDVADLSKTIPLDDVGDAIGESANVSVTMGSFEWISIALSPLSPGGLNYTHTAPCLDVGAKYCKSGPGAMGADHPVYLRSTSHTFPMSLSDLLGGNLGGDGGGSEWLNGITGNDLGNLLNSGVEFSTVLPDDVLESFVGGMLPSGIDADLTLEIVLPTWARTLDNGTSIVLKYDAVDRNHLSEISLGGSDSFDWAHALCTEGVSPCTDASPERYCTSEMKTCVKTDVALDISDISVAGLPLTKSATIEFSLNVSMSVHRIGVPDFALDALNSGSTNMSLEVVPSDLLRLIADIAGRGGSPPEVPFDICPGSLEGAAYCDQTMRLSTDETYGLGAFVDGFGEDLTSMIRAYSISLEKDKDGIGKLDLGSFTIDTELVGLGPVEGTVGDDEAIRLTVRIPAVRLSVGLDNSWFEVISMLQGGDMTPRVGIGTAPANMLVAPVMNPMLFAMEGLTGALTNSLVSADGISPPGGVDVDLSEVNTTVNRAGMELNVVGKFWMRLPLGIVLENATSSDGRVVYYREGDMGMGRQVIEYDLGPQMPLPEVSFTPQIGWNWVFGQLIYYIAAIILFIFWRFRARRLKKQRKRRKLEQQQMAEASEAESVSYVAPVATTEVISVADNGIVIKRRLM